MKKKYIIAFLQLIPVIISYLLIAAHFMRAHNNFLVIVCFALPLVLFVSRPLPVRFVQAGLLLAAVEWLRTTYILAALRVENGQPWMKLAIILGAVACFTLGSAFVFCSKTLKARYKLNKKNRSGG